MAERKFTCARCKQEVEGFPALSRLDNTSKLCSSCETAEAMEEFEKGEITDWRREGNS